MPRPSPAELLRAELSARRKTLPAFLVPQLGHVIDRLDAWVDDTENRLQLIEGRQRALDKLPTAEQLHQLVDGLGAVES